MKYLVVAIIVLGLSAGGGALWYNKVKTSSANTNTHQTAKVERGDLRVSVSATGSVASNNDVDIKCRASGEVIKLPYDISDQVAPGSMVLTLDTVDQQRVLDQAQAQLDYDDARIEAAKNSLQIARLNLETTRERVEANLASINAKHEELKAKLERSRSLFERKLISKEELETAQTAAVQSESDLRQARVAVDELQQQKIQVGLKELDVPQMIAQRKQDVAKKDVAARAVEYCVVNAPPIEDALPGAKWTVSNLQVKIGTLVQSGTSSVSGGAVVMTLSDLNRMFVLATVDESDIGKVIQGQQVSFKCDTFGDQEKFDGKVVRIAVTGKNVQNVITYEVKIEVTSDNKSKLKPMMTANVEIISAEKKDVLLVPMQAVVRKHADPENASTASAPAVTTQVVAATTEPARPAGKGKRKKEPAVYLPGPFPGTAQVLKPDGSIETRELVLGQNDEVNYEVLSGLSEGDTVILNKSTSTSKFSGSGGGRRGPRGG